MKRRREHYERRRQLEQAERNVVDERHEHTDTTHPCRNSDINNIVPAHIMLLSRDQGAVSPTVSKSCRFCSQQYVQIPRRHNFDCHPDVGLLLSLVHLVVCSDCHMTRFACLTWVSGNFTLMEINSTVLSNLNKYAIQRVISRSEINEY